MPNPDRLETDLAHFLNNIRPSRRDLLSGAVAATGIEVVRRNLLTPEIARAEAQIAKPARIEIPKIKVAANIIQVGILKDKNGNPSMETPKDPKKVGWYNPLDETGNELGVKPGEKGTAILPGHKDSKFRKEIFWNLPQLTAGDEIFVTDQNGTKRRFIVTGTGLYTPEDYEILQESMFGFRGEETIGLTLYTCTGTFNRNAHDYSDRFFVYAMIPTNDIDIKRVRKPY